MIWDEFPEEFSADDLASAGNVALGLETDPGMLTQLADRLKAAGEQSGPEGGDLRAPLDRGWSRL
jgi:hypothetical protein